MSLTQRVFEPLCSISLVHDPTSLREFLGGRMKPEQVVRLLQDVARACDVVGLAITEHMPWDTLAMRNMLRQLPLLAG